MINDISNNNIEGKKDFFLLFLILFSMIILSSLFSIILNFNMDYVILFLSIVMIVILFKFKPYIFIKYFCAIFYTIFMLCGLFLCNNSNIYLHEIAKYSHYNGSFQIGVVYNIIFIASLIFFDNYYSKKFKYYISTKKIKKNKMINNLIYIIMFFIGLIMFMFVFKHPSFKYNIDRFAYTELYMPWWLSKLQSMYIYCVPFLMFPIVYNNNKFKLKDFAKIVISLLPFLLFGVWVGNKFGLFFNIFILLLSPLIVYISKKTLKFDKFENLQSDNRLFLVMKRSIKKIIVFSFICLVVLLLPYYTLRGLEIVDSVFNRTAQQGQLWWATYEIERNQGMHLDEINDEIIPLKSSFIGQKIDYTYGVYKIMKITTPSSGYYAKLAIGSRYSAQGIEISFYYFRYFGIILHSFFRGLMEAFLVNLLIKYVFSYKFISSFIISRLIVVNHGIFSQGDLYLLFSKETIFSIILLIFVNMISRKGYTCNNNCKI